jgi:hypothetical protein
MAKRLFKQVHNALVAAKSTLQTDHDVNEHSDGVKRKYAKRLMRICKMLNRPEITLKQMLKHASWLRKHNFGRFTRSTNYGEGLPQLIGMENLLEIRLDHGIYVIYEFTQEVLPYITYIFRYPEERLMLPPFIMPESSFMSEEIHTIVKQDKIGKKKKKKNRKLETVEAGK